MRQVFNIFFKAEDTRPFLVLLCLLVAGTLEAIGVGSLLPAISTIIRSSGAEPTPFETYLNSAISAAGLSPTFGTLLVVAVVFLLVRAVLLFLAMTYAGISGARVTNNLRKRLIKAVFDARWSYYADQSSGRIASVISTEAMRAGDAYNMAAIAAANCVQITSYALVAVFINWRVAVVAIIGGLAIGVASHQFITITRKTGYKLSGRTATLTADMLDMVQNIKALKTMHRYDPMIESLTALIKRLRHSLYVQNVARFGMVYGNDIMMVSILAVASWYAVERAGVPVEQLLIIGILFFQVMSYMAKFLKQVQVASQVEASYFMTLNTIAEAESQREERFGSLPPPANVDFQFKGVGFAHGSKPVLTDVSLTIPSHRITVLQGPSGAGKTTLIDLLVGLHRPQSGSILLGEQSLADTDIIAFRRSIGYVPQELALFHDSIRENISLSEPGISDDDIMEALRLAGADGFIASLPSGLDTDVGEFGGKLSGGQRQRISLARALVRKPDVLVLDEVTSALDPETESAIVDNIAGLRGKYTIIAITHRPAWTRIADVQYTFLGGRVAATPKPAALAPASEAKSPARHSKGKRA